MRPIDADVLLEDHPVCNDPVRIAVMCAPTLTADDLREKGEWKVFEHDNEFYGECSECKHIRVAREAYAMNFCPCCGAEMWGHE